MKLAIFGATGLVGNELVAQAAARGHTMRILSRSDIPKDKLPAGAELIRGDYFNAEDVHATVIGADAVLSTIGPPQHNKTDLKPADYGQAMEQLIAQMQATGVARIINIASTGTRLGDEPYGLGRRLIRFLLKFIAPVVIPCKEQELEALVRSDRIWTTIRPPLIKSGIGGVLKASDQTPQGSRIDTGLLVGFMLDQLDARDWENRAPFVGS